MSFNAHPEVDPVRAAERIHPRRRVRAHWLMLLGGLLMLTAGITPAAPPPGVMPATRQFEVPQEQDHFKREEMQRLAQENTERHRMRVSLPSAAFIPPPPVAPATTTSDGNNEVTALLRPGAVTRFVFKLVCIILVIVLWLVIARKLSPDFAEYVTGRLRARSVLPAVSTHQLVTLLAEEQAVAQFQASLRGGDNSPSADAVGATDDVTADDGTPYSTACSHIREMRRLLQEAARTEATTQRRFLLDAIDRIQTLKSASRAAELLPLRQLTVGVEMLLKQLTEKTSNVTSSTLRTAALGVTLMEDLCQAGLRLDLLSDPPLRLLAVDDETFSRFALANSLKRGLSEPDVADNGKSALALAGKNTYDLIVLDVQMPDMDGFELCSKIHECAANASTPVIFVTSMRDFDARANSILCGGRDLIAKPFLTFELCVKALTLVARERLRGRGRPEDAPATIPEKAAAAAPLPEAASASVAQVEALKKIEAAPPAESKRLPRVPTTVPDRSKSVVPVGPAATFFTQALAQIDKVQNLVELAMVTPDHRVQQEMITDLFLGVHSLAVIAEEAGQPSIAMTAAALEGLLKKLLQDTANLSASTLQTIATAAALLQELCVSQSDPQLALSPPIKALTVDDDPVALRALSNALQRTFSKPENGTDGKSALALAADKHFDVIFLDVQMPDLDGFEVCSRIREASANRQTPIVFLSGRDATNAESKSKACGGNGFLTKPSLASELNLTALTYALRGRLRNTAPLAPPVPTPAAATAPVPVELTEAEAASHGAARTE
jgi:DNA-binding response OmpR family regulator